MERSPLIICAPDSFKESMTAAEAAEAMERGIRRALGSCESFLVPLADGGEGTGEALRVALGGELVDVQCHDALSRPIAANIVHVPGRRLAVVEMAAAAGLELLGRDERDARSTTTYGVGELFLAALDLGVDEILVGLGGSATNDAGAGMCTALGVRFFDEHGAPLPPGGAALARLAAVDTEHIDPRLRDVRITIASDVTNPLLGTNGASHIFGPQKGADSQAVVELDAALRQWADVVEPAVGKGVRDVPGAGAAGGLGAGLLAFTNATIRSGADFIMDTVGFDDLLKRASLVLTGEGSWDAQSAAGKVPAAVAARAAAHGVPTVIFAGRVQDADAPLPDGVLAAVPIVDPATDLDTALADGAHNLEGAVADALQHLRLPPTHSRP
ncbi:MAG: glycerate kinase [Propionibacteriaceae bacterium]|nr:glycerate kinase [Propionibacteriaceae bacterium]